MLFHSRQLILQIGHFRVPLGLCIKRRLSAQPLIWKWLFILVQIKLISQGRLCTWPRFESGGFWNLEVAYWHQRATLLVCENTQILMNPFITDPGQAMGIFPKDLPTFTWKEVDVSGRILCPMLTTQCCCI